MKREGCDVEATGLVVVWMDRDRVTKGFEDFGEFSVGDGWVSGR